MVNLGWVKIGGSKSNTYIRTGDISAISYYKCDSFESYTFNVSGKLLPFDSDEETPEVMQQARDLYDMMVKLTIPTEPEK